MNVIPAVDLREGACVQLEGGDMTAERVRRPDPVAEARRWHEMGAEWIHVVDLDRALGRGSNLRVVQRILEEVPAKMVVGGGVRMFDEIDALLNAGAARVVIGTRAVTEPDFLREAASRYGNRLVVAVDARGEDIVVKGWTESSGHLLLDFAKQAGSLGIGALLYTDVGLEGRMTGPNVESVRRLAAVSRAPVVASGGIASMQDLDALREAGAWGAVVGMAAYTGKLDMQSAL
ncbi:MAG TPA: 1-(5-phosphoribosyl)-5-[(5-phosphoribosylamino)methylideneamino]imidazole-4-carboxamide isomerase, partial [Candidatus Thermoplasmatota archaeon]|nr:1-(5-phosphoribosyl)-5-[(5-phosphoribosylamino)methylideneamino]imidazole-4-carboxamide isomerase [Candidatus Thermoplasmatota archaeon]